MTVGLDYALSTLSTIFPKALANNFAFMFTGVSNPLSWNFSMDIIPEVLKDADLFMLDNPIAQQERYLRFKGDLGKRKYMMDMRRVVLAVEEDALGMLVDFFDWLDGLGTQPTADIVYLYDLSQSIEAIIMNILAQIDGAAAKKAEIDKLIVALKNNTKVSFLSCYCLGFDLILA